MTIKQRTVLEGDLQNHQTIVQNIGNLVTALAKTVNSGVARKLALVELGNALFGEVIPCAIAEESFIYCSDEARSDLGSSMNDIDTERQVLSRPSSRRLTRLRSRRDSLKPSRSVGISGRVATAWVALRTLTSSLAVKSTAFLHGLAGLVTSGPFALHSPEADSDASTFRGLDTHHLAKPPTKLSERILNRRNLWCRARRIVALPIAALALAGCTVPTFGASPGVTTSSRSVYHLWQGFSIGAAIIGSLVVVLILWSVIFHRRKGDNFPKQTQYHIPIELTYIILPIVIVVGLFAWTMVVENQEVANPKTNVTINVHAFQWGWKFTYPGQNVVVIGQTTQNPEMVMPVDENVHINLTSSDVIHSFYVHAFNFSRFALPGVLNQFTFRAVNTGTYQSQCSEICGLYHALMVFRVKVVTQSQYGTWLASRANAGAAQASRIATNQQTSSIVPTKPAKSKGDN